MLFNHQYWMSKAMELARKIKDEVPVSAIIVKDNVLISQATNKTEQFKDPTAHAEILAIQEASKALGNWRLNDCILYTTLEPCAMCAGAIINSRVSKLIFGAYDLNCGACGSVFNLFRELSKNNQIEVIGGVLEIEAGMLLKDFFALRR